MLGKKCYIIAGSTASGKSSFALELAKKINGAIINGDSKQVYDVLHVLTAQPFDPIASNFHVQSDHHNVVINSIDHYLYGYFPHTKRMDMMQWLEDCKIAILKVLSQGKTPIIVGGTGFYLNALQDGIVQIPDVTYQTKFDDMDNAELHDLLAKLDPDLNIPMNDKYRIIRALNVVSCTGKKYSWWLQQKKQKILDIPFHSIHISRDKQQVYESAKSRLDEMFPRVISEVQELGEIAKHINSIIGVNEIRMMINGQMNLEEVKNLILIKTMQYAKQQRTWFRNKMQFDEVI